ncbi:XdhC/CoxI family protein [Bremerella cremea]|uniref:XdhC/CoxI family protein n=1 Tax=Blastopirellula marina TaxID=124 RepID=A0A2S8FQX5_9BACT|nr:MULTISPECIES: XdhC/CoxI family protein [Pirellulaceae]PQO34572.1 hypothetical protein C5Y83_13750 [Blastopirellula marina]RCS47069.1 XdhC/CoxI family protein [Bremerella cremea]
MRDVLTALVADVPTGKSVAYCQLIDTRGSTPQKAGAAMLVYAGGQQVGTLGGGCVEAEVKRLAIAHLETGQGTVSSFVLDHDYGWDDGLICGGRMEVLIQPLAAGGDVRFFQAILDAITNNVGGTFVIATLPRESESGPSFGMHWISSAGKSLAQCGEASLRAAAAEVAAEHLRSLAERPLSYRVNNVLFLPILPRCELLIIGGGHVGKAVARLAAKVDFDVTVVDDREEAVSLERFPDAVGRIAGPMLNVLPQIELSEQAYGLVVTRGHQHDEMALYHLVQRKFAYLGMIGSKRKVRMIYDDLLEKGIPQEKLDQVHAPVGLDIGSRTVEEIAISIVAQLIAHRSRATT